MEKKRIRSVFPYLAALVLSGYTLSSSAQQETLLTIQGQPVSKTEFENIFKKNNKETAVDKKALDEYVELFINFKLKVKEAEELKLDTIEKFQEELSGYRKQLARPYLTDHQMSEALLQEAYDRTVNEIRASHILIKVQPDASPADTLEAYNKIVKLRERIIAGESFEEVARSREGSEDPSVADNGGDLGYFKAFDMVYPFENAAYKTEVGKISQPIRTDFGYHIIKVVGKREARGTIKVAHIMISKATILDEGEDAAEKKINEIHQKITNGEDFATLAKQFSEDRASARNGGELPEFSTGRMVEKFEDMSFSLQKDGEISKPFKTKFGWHIAKRLSYSPPPPFEEIKRQLETQISRDSRSQLLKKSFLEKLKKEYGYKEYTKSFNKVVKALDTAVYNGNWQPASKLKFNKKLYVLNGNTSTQQELVDLILKTQREEINRPTLQQYARKKLDDSIDKKLIELEDSMLEKKHNEFKMLMKEYRDGILLFELTDRKVWSKAIKDTTGLESFYSNNKNNYLWDERIDATVFQCKDAAIAKKTKLLLSKGKSTADINKEINNNSSLNITIDSGVFTKGDNDIVDQFDWKKGESEEKSINGQTIFIVVNKILPPTPKTLEEARGLVTSEYQNFLEKQWIDSLKKKYTVEVDKTVLYSIE